MSLKLGLLLGCPKVLRKAYSEMSVDEKASRRKELTWQENELYSDLYDIYDFHNDPIERAKARVIMDELMSLGSLIKVGYYEKSFGPVDMSAFKANRNVRWERY